MVKKVNRNIEKYFFNTLPETLVPFEATVRNGELVVESFRRTIKSAKKFHKQFYHDPFSDEAIAFIVSELSSVVSGWGYFTDDIKEGHIITYVADIAKSDLILDSTHKIKKADGYINLTEYELESIDEEDDACYFVTVIDGKIVSVCETNAQDAFIGAKEINVYTAHEYRGLGYGASNVSAMVKHYISLGYRVAYTSRKDNSASCALAEKCGFDKVAETYYYICYKEE